MDGKFALNLFINLYFCCAYTVHVIKSDYCNCLVYMEGQLEPGRKKGGESTGEGERAGSGNPKIKVVRTRRNRTKFCNMV